ncbi:MAG: hypothetical protein Q9159_000829 [Coniocarpon cinnabarinum]
MSRPILPQGDSAGQQQQPPPPPQLPQPPQQQQQPQLQYSDSSSLQPYQPQPAPLDPTQYGQTLQDPSLVSPTSAHMPQDSSLPGSAAPSKPTYAKRGKITIVACVPCRKRKTKCDGHRPSCTQCSSRNGPCSYDMTDDQRKLTYLRDSVEQLQTDKTLLEQLFQTVQVASQEEAIEVFRRLRSGGDLHQVAEEIQAGTLLSGVGGGTPARHDGRNEPSGNSMRRAAPRLDHYERLVRALALSDYKSSQDIVNRLKASEDIPSILRDVTSGSQDATRLIQRRTPSGVEGSFASSESIFGMVKGAEMRSTHASLASEFITGNIGSHWSNVTQDSELIKHLLDHYFTWQHSFFQSFPEDLFRTDFANGETKFCSPALVNAICAAGCMLSFREGTDKLVNQFYDEATRLLRDNTQPTITTVAALYLTSYVEGSKGRLSALWMSSGASALMAVDLSLQLKRKLTSDQNIEISEEALKEDKARCHAFWGCFHVDQITSFTLGRLPNINAHGVTVDLPSIQDEFDQKPWHPYGSTERPDIPGARSSTFRACSELSTLVNGTLQMFFAPTVPLSGSLLVSEYEKYSEWKQGLPPLLNQTQEAPPHVLCLHMYYHSAILLLFRPFLKAKILSRSDLVPRQLARSAADEISDIWSYHKKLYGYYGIYMFQVHCLLTACTIHIISIPTPSATTRFTDACNYFHDLSQRHEWARSALETLQNLVKKWSLILPKDTEEALWRDAQGRPHSPEPALVMSPPSFTQPTDPQSAVSMTRRFGDNTGSNADALFQDQQNHQAAPANASASNIDPALSSSTSTPPQPQTQSALKRTASQRSSTQNSPPSTRSSRTETFPIGPKRPRMVASAQSQTSGGQSTPAAGLGTPGDVRNVALAPQMQNPANLLYAPGNQPAPMLRPVRHSSSTSSNSGVSQNQQATAAHGTSTAAPTAQMQAAPDIKSEITDNPQAPAVLAAQGTAAQTRAREAANQGQLSESDQRQAVAVPPQPDPNFIEGLSFSDDFRDPFMGEVLLGLTGRDFTVVASSKAAMRGVTILKANDDKTRKLSDHTVMAYSGEAGDTVQFSEYIQANIALYGTRNGAILQPPAIAAFTRNELARALRSQPYNANCLIGGIVMPPPTSQTSHISQSEKPSSTNPSEPAATTSGTTAAPTTGEADETKPPVEDVSATKPIPKLYWLDYLATLASVPYAAHGYAQYYCLSTLDKHHHPDMSLEQGLKVLRMCSDELRRRMPIDYKGLNVKVITAEGIKDVEFEDDANIKPW